MDQMKVHGACSHDNEKRWQVLVGNLASLKYKNGFATATKAEERWFLRYESMRKKFWPSMQASIFSEMENVMLSYILIN